MMDTPISLPRIPSGAPGVPHNYDAKFTGKSPVRQALTGTATYQQQPLTHQINIITTISLTTLEPSPLALGTYKVTH